MKAAWKYGWVLLISAFLFGCASSNSTGYKPKYKKPNPNKPMPCPLKDC
jgi:hypothetical protein